MAQEDRETEPDRETREPDRVRPDRETDRAEPDRQRDSQTDRDGRPPGGLGRPALVAGVHSWLG